MSTAGKINLFRIDYKTLTGTNSKFKHKKKPEAHLDVSGFFILRFYKSQNPNLAGSHKLICGK
ncbi:hypothetical protein SAMN05444274_102456 [Mariniphaga anaerophila]|uniref:Uncharacterized protein n=1 Tax=Mariniphaga anaerophila TaxID=1484053 RepID=A0A1M4WIG1_9BACT|nr:hypothetical protein SAMN05444274_102456 [Mariniphaga anaerophila]